MSFNFEDIIKNLEYIKLEVLLNDSISIKDKNKNHIYVNHKVVEGKKIYRNEIFIESISINKFEKNVKFENCIFLEFVSLTGKEIGCFEKGYLEIKGCYFFDGIHFVAEKIINSRINIRESFFFGRNSEVAINLFCCKIKNSEILIRESNINGFQISLEKSKINESKIDLENSIEVGDLLFEEAEIKSSSMNLSSGTYFGYHFSFKKTKIDNSRVSLFDSKINCNQFSFESSNIKNSSISFDKSYFEDILDISSYESIKGRTEINATEMIFDKMKLEDSNLIFSETFYQVVNFKMNNVLMKGNCAFENVIFKRLDRFELQESILSEGKVNFDNFDIEMGTLSFQKTSFLGIINIKNFKVGFIDLRNTEVLSIFQLNLLDIIEKNEPRKLFFKNEKNEIDYLRTYENLKFTVAIFDNLKNEEEYNYLYYWLKKTEELTYKDKNIIHNIFYNFYYLFYGKMTDYMLNWKKVMKSMIRTILFFGMLYTLINLFNMDGNCLKYDGKNLYNYYEFCICKQMFLRSNTIDFVFSNFYFSLISFTTIGYGDITPVGIVRLIAGIEGLIGIYLCGALIATLGKRFNLKNLH